MCIVCRNVAVLLLSLILSGCAAMPMGESATATVPQEQSASEPVEIRIVEGEQQQTLLPTDDEFAAAVSALQPVLESIHDQARTFFSPDRFAQEIEPIAHVYVRFEDEKKFSGQEIEWIASELIIAQPNGEAMLLARTPNTVDWSVYLPADPTTIEEFLNALTGP